MAKKTRIQTQTRRRQAAVRAAICRRRLVARRLRHVCPLVDVLAAHAALSEKLPWPSQIRIAREAGVSERTARRWIAEAERVGVVQVFRSLPERRSDGTWTRATNRYLLRDQALSRSGACCPVPRKHGPVDSEVSPTGHARPVIPFGVESGGAPFEVAPPTADDSAVNPVGPVEEWRPDEGERLRAAEILAKARAALS